MKIAIQGERGSFSHQAALQFETSADINPCMLSRDAFERVVLGQVDAIAIPIENTLAGAVVEHYDLLREYPVHIERETIVRIEHHVIGIPGSDIEGIQRIYSHPVALAQCRSFFRQYPQIEPMSFYDTAGAVKQIVQLRDGHSAAIAGMQAATIYGGAVLVQAVEDDCANYTRFLLVRAGAATRRPQGEHKMSFCFQLEHRRGALAAVLEGVGEVDGNITKMQARPVHGQPWRYHFFVDAVLPHAAGAQRLLERLPALCVDHKLLGQFAAAPEFVQPGE